MVHVRLTEAERAEQDTADSYTPAILRPQHPVPAQSCNLVMKGGVTSGVVFTGTICDLASEYRFKRLGGTSAGAIAAALAAAAEYRRTHDHDAQNAHLGFKRLWEMSNEFGEAPKSPVSTAKTNLEALFAPNHSTRNVHRLLTAGAQTHSPGVQVLKTLIATYSLPSSLALLGGAATVAGFSGLIRNGVRTTPLLLSLVGTYASAAGAGLLIRDLLVKERRHLEQNHYGLATGFEKDAQGEPERFTEWLHRVLNDVAGLAENEVLTFDHLSPGAYKRREELGQKIPTSEREMEELFAHDGDIELRQITTCLSLGRPYSLPIDPEHSDAQSFSFDPDEWSRFFPKSIINHLKEKGSQLPNGTYLLPHARDMPVVVTTRLSMSFPGLFSAVPMFYRTVSAKTSVRVYFSDGGLTSNFPLTLFDELIPNHPTFALNLEYEDKRTPSKSQSGRSQVIKDMFRVIDPEPLRAYGQPDTQTASSWEPTVQPVNSIPTYLKSILESARNWADNALIPLPGYMERIAHVTIQYGQGGTNLTMNASAIRLLRWRGAMAGQKLRERFNSPNSAWNWEVHRAASFITLTADLESLLQEYASVFSRNKSWHVPGLGQVPLQPNGSHFAALNPNQQRHVNELIAFGDQATTMRGYRRLRGKRAVLRYRPIL